MWRLTIAKMHFGKKSPGQHARFDRHLIDEDLGKSGSGAFERDGFTVI